MNTCHDLLNSLYDYHLLLNEINMLVTKDRADRGLVPIRLEKKTSLSYTFLRIELKEQDEGALFLQCEFRITAKDISCQQIYCEDKVLEPLIKKTISAKTFAWGPGSKSDQFDSEHNKYFTIADAIAEKGYNCNAGDNYSPGYFSDMMISDKGISLEQINHWNAKSSAHKENYHLRNLEFYIPSPNQEVRSVRYDYQIGNMWIIFSDRSSKNNKGCGDAILKSLLEEKGKF